MLIDFGISAIPSLAVPPVDRLVDMHAHDAAQTPRQTPLPPALRDAHHAASSPQCTHPSHDAPRASPVAMHDTPALAPFSPSRPKYPRKSSAPPRAPGDPSRRSDHNNTS